MWVPSVWGYRHSLSLLTDPDLSMAAEAAEAEAECALIGSGGNDPCWQGRAGAVVIYAMWALKVLRHRGLLEPSEFEKRLAWLATDIQRRVKTREGSNSWLRPEWWGSDLHTTHRELLMDRSDTYRQRFTNTAGLLPLNAPKLQLTHGSR